jgi:hypothetical protein
MMHAIAEANDASGVPIPTWKIVASVISTLSRYDAGILTRNADNPSCSMANIVFPQPLKNPLKQNTRHTSRQSHEYGYI